MYFKVSMRTNPVTGVYSGYYRLVQSYRNYEDRVYHRIILNAGYLDELTTDQWFNPTNGEIQSRVTLRRKSNQHTFTPPTRGERFSTYD